MKSLLLLLALTITGCSDPTPQENTELNVTAQSGRIRVVSAQTIRDARGYPRDILVLEDSETGKSYLAVMGAGVQEMVTHSHTTGKTTYTTEEEE